MFDVTPVTSPRANDCGPTCLKMLLAYHGTDVDLDTLIEECDVGLAGCSGADLLRAGRLHGLDEEHGLDMTAWRVDADELLGIDRPSIVHWRHSHWCVLCGVDDDDGRVVICNPDRGRYHMSKGTFAALYTGVAITAGDPKDGPLATDNIEAGQLFELSGQMWRALVAIARGERVTADNAEQVSVADALNELGSAE